MRAARRRRAIDNWFLALLVVACAAFAAVVAVQVLQPAADQVTTSSDTWDHQGP